MRLTDVAVRALPYPARGQKTHWDDTLPNFGCRVSQGGTKSFVLQHGRDRRLITLGRFPVISLANAREQAKRTLAEFVLGRHRPRSIRWNEAVALYLAACKDKNRASTLRGYERLLHRHFRLQDEQLSAITFEDVERRLNRIKAIGERNHALTAVKAFFAWCQKPPRRYIPHNPCEGMSPVKRRPRRRVLSDPELAAVFKTALEGTDVFSHIVAMLVLTGQRRGETTALQKSWCNRRDRLITLPDYVTKNYQEHTFPYGDLVESILVRLSNVEGHHYFSAYRTHVRGVPTTTYNGWSKDKIEFDKRCGVSNWTLHDLRRTFATRLAEAGVLPHVLERLLNHRMGSISNRSCGIISQVAEIYNLATYLPEMRNAIALWENKLTTLLNRSI